MGSSLRNALAAKRGTPPVFPDTHFPVNGRASLADALPHCGSLILRRGQGGWLGGAERWRAAVHTRSSQPTAHRLE